MKRNIVTTLISLTLLLSSNSWAQTRWAEVVIDTTQPLVEMKGILFSKNESFQVPDVQLSTVDKSRSILAVPYSAELAAGDNYYIYAFAKSESGEFFYSNTQKALPDIDPVSGFAQSICGPKEFPQSMQSEISLIANLVKVRDRRRDNLRSQINGTLSGDFLKKMQKWEKGAGLERNTELNPELSAYELVDRLNRILHTLKQINVD